MTGLLVVPGDAVEAGSGQLTTTQGGYNLDVFTYRPAECTPRGVLLVFHGNSRNADDYRDYARPFADSSCLTVFAPHFDRERFRSWAYHRGGVIRRGAIRWRSEWTVSMIEGLAKWALAQAGGSDKALFLFGHSAGGQFVSRVAAYAPLGGVRRFVVANPSSHVWPSLDESVPYGFGSFPEEAAALKSYLYQPVTIYLGSRDTGSRLLTQTPGAVRQGENRLERGRNTFNAAVAGNCKSPISGNRKLHTLIVGVSAPVHAVGKTNRNGAEHRCTDGRRGCCSGTIWNKV